MLLHWTGVAVREKKELIMTPRVGDILTEVGESRGGVIWGRNKFDFGQVKFEMPVGHPGC